MWKLVQSGLSVVAGTAEPEYGPEAIHPVCSNLSKDEPLYSPLSPKDLEYQVPSQTCVETQTFYFADETYSGFAQVIHSNLVGLHTTAQFTFKAFKKSKPDAYVWTSTKLENFTVAGPNFYADNLSIEVDDALRVYRIKSSVNPASIVDLNLELIGESVKFGKDGTTYYGTDLANPWGSMRHIFWPRCKASGTIKLGGNKQFEQDITLNSGLGMYVMALQGMKPHHAAAAWNFLNYQSENYSVVVMEFTTPKSYNTTTVSVGIVTDQDGRILLGSVDNTTKHLKTYTDPVSGWNVPGEIEFTLRGKSVEVQVSGALTNLSERVDVMNELPQFVKNIASGVAGTKPYIFQFSNELDFKLVKDGKVEHTETGYGYTETTFISDVIKPSN
ncbi:hypothetical protein KL909_003967 [Ogataea angusta]|nr:hypothetical protein KL909_003967 [Ogataea angusta]